MKIAPIRDIVIPVEKQVVVELKLKTLHCILRDERKNFA